MIQFKLKGRERQALLQLVRQTPDAITLRRSQALLWLDQGHSIAEIAARLNVSRQVIYQWIEIFRRPEPRALAVRLASGTRSGRPPTIQGVIDPLIDEVIDHDPRLFNYNSTVWTAPLLADYLSDYHQLSASVSSIKLALARLEITWKRPRHVLAWRSPTWRQAKGGLKKGFLRARAR